MSDLLWRFNVWICDRPWIVLWFALAALGGMAWHNAQNSVPCVRSAMFQSPTLFEPDRQTPKCVEWAVKP